MSAEIGDSSGRSPQKFISSEQARNHLRLIAVSMQRARFCRSNASLSARAPEGRKHRIDKDIAPALCHDLVTVLPGARRSHRTLAGAIVAGAGDATDEIRRHWRGKAAPMATSGADRASGRSRNKILATQRSAVGRFQPNRAATAGRAGDKTRVFHGVGVSAVRSLGVDQIHVQWSLTPLNVTIHSVPDHAPKTAALDRSEAR